MEELVYFELDNWFPGRDYPNAEPFTSWMGDDSHLKFADEQWCKENRLCVLAGFIDMSVCFCITATHSWIEQNCPKLLTDEECGNSSIITYFDKEQNTVIQKEVYESSKYSKFICTPEKKGEVYGRLSGWTFLEYCEENFGIHWYEDIER